MTQDYLEHYGTPRRSGRYPWGSGDDGYQRGGSWLGTVKQYKKEGMSEKEIATAMGMSVGELRARNSIERTEQRRMDRDLAVKLLDKGYSKSEIGRRMGINESSVRALLDPTLQERADIAMETSNILRKSVEDKNYIDIGSGVETHLGVSRTKMDTAVEILKQEGYKVQYLKVEQQGVPGKYTTVKVLTKDDVEYKELYANREKVRMVTDYSEDGGRSWNSLEPVNNISSRRVAVRYADEGGVEKDGVIEVRPGVGELSLGQAHYAQVRIGVDGTHFLKGMVVYNDNLPEGIDILYNTNKKSNVPKDKVFKSNEDEDPTNPFGTTIRQKYYIDSDGQRKLSALNIVYEEGDWSNWSRTISSQVLSKQLPPLVKKQLDLALGIRKDDFDELNSLTNPAVKKRLMETFADDCDAAAVHLKAAALPRQVSHVILPVPSLKDNEVFAPGFNDGEPVVLIRHPHGGIFEIPELYVNNKNPEAIKLISKKAKDAVGINANVAQKLSGADFDGDTVIVIPNRNGQIKTAPTLRGLKDFDAKTSYPKYPGMKVMSEKTKQLKMGDVSNLITDMTIKGANFDEIARAVRHSMVVIDAVKHELDYKKSYVENGIASLKEKYQGSSKSGASTLISKASSEKRVPERKMQYSIDQKTGRKIYKLTGNTYVDKNGKVVTRMMKSTKMAEETDARKLSSGTVKEDIYASYANDLKALANKARLTYSNLEGIKYSPAAKKTYSKEVESLKAKLALAYRNKPLERQAQIIANHEVSTRRKANPQMEADDLKKLRSQALEGARIKTGAKKSSILITDSEWNAIQSGAISNNALNQILLNTDVDSLRQRALPRSTPVMSPSKLARGRSMLNSGYTRAEVASALGVSVSSLDRAIE